VPCKITLEYYELINRHIPEYQLGELYHHVMSQLGKTANDDLWWDKLCSIKYLMQNINVQKQA